MSAVRRSLLAATVVLILLTQSATARGQADAASPNLALDSCVAAADKGDFVNASLLADAAERPLRSRLSTSPDDVEALVALARVLSQCRVPAAELLERGELSGEAIDLLDRALAVQPRHWLARYLLARNYFQAPSFMDRSEAAAWEFDALIAQQGDATQPAIFARPFEFRGLLWIRAGRSDSARSVWARGLRLFPADSALLMRIGALPGRDGVEATSAAAPPQTMASVVIRSARETPLTRATARIVRRPDVLMSPGAAADVSQALLLQGGATLVGDGADLHARGGDAAETRLLLNGSPLVGAVKYESLDGSLFSALDPQVLSSTRFSPGGFSVRIGNALSGVIEAETDGRPREAQQRFGLSVVSASATMRGPLGPRAGVWGSTRLSHTGPMLWMNGRAGEYSAAPRSIDAMGGLTLAPDARTEVRAVALVAADEVTREVARGDHRGGYTATGESGALNVSVRSVAATSPIVRRAAVSASGRRSTQRFGVLDRSREEGAATLHGDVERQASQWLRVRGGIDGALLAQREAGTVPLSEALAPGAPAGQLEAGVATATHLGAWTEAQWNAGRVHVVAGIRADRLPMLTSITLDPRVDVSFTTGSIRAHGAIGVFHQGAWRTSADHAFPKALLDVPTKATHHVLGVEGQGEWEWRLESFLKSYENYVARSGPRVVRGRVMGAEAVVRRPAQSDRRVDGWMVYAVTRSRVTLADGGEIPGTFDVTHALTTVTTWRPDDRWRVGLTNRMATGTPFTSIVSSVQDTGGRWTPVYGATHAARLPAYVRTDLRVTRLVPSNRGLAVLFVEGINLFNRPNVVAWSWDATWRDRMPVTQFFGRRTLVMGVELQR